MPALGAAAHARGRLDHNTASVNSKKPTPNILPYSATKGALANLTIGLAGLLAEKKIRVNAVLPGPIWTRRPGQLGWRGGESGMGKARDRRRCAAILDQEIAMAEWLIEPRKPRSWRS
ncbi:SDR family NAD(P)-dependent oxidoreductase [Pantoea ananatis]|uniref:SDR family NAD(P)-dependent oxidoreductase n=1 Tax=Pantoea ananas TaxID=553 RepID=UPI00221E6203|nr:SDR family NAD(P)-dependent oxidoreductase [Pantoea ananatis]